MLSQSRKPEPSKLELVLHLVMTAWPCLIPQILSVAILNLCSVIIFL
jgi:hypothetical protein